MDNWIDWIPGILFLLGFIPYGYAIWVGKAKPQKVSWFVWLFLDLVMFGSRVADGYVSYQLLGLSIGTAIIFILALKFGTTDHANIDKICLGGTIIAVVVWFISGDPTVGLLITLIVWAIGFIPTFLATWRNPSRENGLGWIIFLAGCVASVALIPEWKFETFIQPIIFLVGHVIMVGIIYLRPRPNRNII